MTTAVSILSKNTDLAQYTPDQIQLIINTVAKGATMDELQLFLYRCKLLHLDPLKPQQVHFIKYGQSPGVIVVGIEGIRSMAARTGRHVSTNRGVLRDEKGSITYGWCRIKRLDANNNEQEFYEETPFGEYFKGKNPSWNSMPETMIKKCAEAACIRMAYPDDCGGIFIQEEREVMEHIEDNTNHRKVFPEQPGLEDHPINPDAEYTVNFGQWIKRTIPEICKKFSVDQIEGYLDKLEEHIKTGKFPENHEKFKDFITRMSGYLADQERVVEDMPDLRDLKQPETISIPGVFKLSSDNKQVPVEAVEVGMNSMVPESGLFDDFKKGSVK